MSEGEHPDLIDKVDTFLENVFDGASSLFRGGASRAAAAATSTWRNVSGQAVADDAQRFQAEMEAVLSAIVTRIIALEADREALQTEVRALRARVALHTAVSLVSLLLAVVALVVWVEAR
jgi:hypothetical protein